jgi:hypothetical protein
MALPALVLVHGGGLDDSGEFLHQTRDGRDDALVFAEGIVTAQPEGWHGGNTIVRDDGRTAVIGRKWLIRVPHTAPGSVGPARSTTPSTSPPAAG